MNKEIYTDILRRLRDAIRRKRLEKSRTSSWSLLHDNAPAHRSVLVKDCSAKNDVITWRINPYSPDLAPVYFYLLPRLKSAPQGRRFCDGADIRMRRRSWKGFHKMPSRNVANTTVAGRSAQGSYFEGNVACIIVLFFLPLRNKVISRTFWSYHVFQKVVTDSFVDTPRGRRR